MFNYIHFWTKFSVLKLIRLYQKTLSFDHGFLKDAFPFYGCKFYPTCSEYAYQAIQKYGIIKGGYKGCQRLLKCHPYSDGGYDPLK